MKRLLLALSLTSVVSQANQCSHFEEGSEEADNCNYVCNVGTTDASIFMCEIASQTSTVQILHYIGSCLDWIDQPDFSGSDCLQYVIQPFFNELSAGAVTQEAYDAALQAQTTAEAAAATAAAALQAAQDDAEADLAQKQDELHTAQDTLANAAEVCPEVQSAGGVYSVGPLDCDRIHSVYQNNQCCGTC